MDNGHPSVVMRPPGRVPKETLLLYSDPISSVIAR
jgi:hypothetical protein